MEMRHLKAAKGIAVLLAVILTGTAACGAKSGSEGTYGETTVTPALQGGTEGEPTVTPAGQGGTEGEPSGAPSVMPEDGDGAGKAPVTEKPSQDTPAVTVTPELRAAVEKIKENEVTEAAERTASITLSDSGIRISGSGCEAEKDRLKIKEAGTYEITGTLSDGSIYVNADNESEVHLILNGVTIHNDDGAAIFCKKAKKVTITLAKGSVNTLSDGADYVFEEGEDEPDAALYAKHDLVLNGSGELRVTSAYGDAVKGKDALYILGGSFTINAADDGIIGRDLLYIADGSFSVTAENDAFKATNDTDAASGNIMIDGGVFRLTAGADGIQAETALRITGGSFSITTGGGAEKAPVRTEWNEFGGRGQGRPGNNQGTAEQETASAKGLKAGKELALSGGSFVLDTVDDALHSNQDIAITGGEFQIATGDDGVHADESLVIEGSTVLRITKSYEGLESKKITISGGEIEIVASDDGLNAASGTQSGGFGRPGMGMSADASCEIVINGGSITVNASGDGIDSNGNITMNGGSVLAYGPTSSGNGVLDYDGTFLLNGGTLLCIGTSSMAQMPAGTSGQYSLAAVLPSGAAAGSKVEILVDGNRVLAAEAQKSFNYIVASSAEFLADADVSILVDGTESYAGALTEVVTCFGITGGMQGGFGGFGGGMQGGFGGGRGDMGGMPWQTDGERPEGGPDGERPEMPEGGMWRQP